MFLLYKSAYIKSSLFI